ncbi:MAG: hypothetical protein GWP05_09525 [Anaerolineaceae bacterium]|nr:hypothetical protein [Anaerolineaceae bacterium]
MAEPLVCKCGQTLNVTSFEPGRQVRCPSCQEVLTVPRKQARPESPPQVAMAMAVDDEESDVQPAAGTGPGRRLDPMARRKMAARRSAYAAQSKLKKFMIWPSLVLGLASFAVAAFGVWDMVVRHETIELVTETDPASGVEITHMYARVETEKGSGVFERVEVQPDVYPGDQTDGDEFTLSGVKPTMRGGAWLVKVGDEQLAVERRGYWFYEVDMASDKKPKPLIRKVELPLVAMTRSGGGPEAEDAVYRYVRVKWKGKAFVDPSSGRPINNVSYYRLDENGIQDKPITGEFEKYEASFLAKLVNPVFLIISGLIVGALLLTAAVFFAWEAYFSAAAKKQREQQKQQAAA